MPQATLLLREEASTSLTTLVEKSQQRKPPLPEYDLQLNNNQLDLVLKSKPETSSADEGFESDIDSLSIVSSDGSFTPEGKTTETDSANGSASSDSDTENSAHEPARNHPKESYNLVECLCYTDVKFPEILVFVIKTEALVFKFGDIKVLRSFYLNFTALKAVTSQKVYNKNSATKFNLLHRTDNNGVTHIEITREPDTKIIYPSSVESTNIISLNTPEACRVDTNRKNVDVGKTKDIINSRQRNNYKTLPSSTENILNSPQSLVTEKSESLRKVWNSAEDLLNSPKRPERRKKAKGKAPPPPLCLAVMPQKIVGIPDILRGEYVRVNVSSDLIKEKDFIAKSQVLTEKRSPKNNFVTLLSPKVRMEPSWTNSVPRLLRKQRSKSETRHFTPMAYRYIDTTPTYSPMSNRLFGLSPKLRDFTLEKGKDEGARWNSVGELSYGKSEGSNLKSVIKKDDNKKKSNEKKVTFSAYTTVQVV